MTGAPTPHAEHNLQQVRAAEAWRRLWALLLQPLPEEKELAGGTDSGLDPQQCAPAEGELPYGKHPHQV